MGYKNKSVGLDRISIVLWANFRNNLNLMNFKIINTIQSQKSHKQVRYNNFSIKAQVHAQNMARFTCTYLGIRNENPIPMLEMKMRK